MSLWLKHDVGLKKTRNSTEYCMRVDKKYLYENTPIQIY